MTYDVVVFDNEAPYILNPNDLLVEISGFGFLHETNWALLDSNGDTIATEGG